MLRRWLMILSIACAACDTPSPASRDRELFVSAWRASPVNAAGLCGAIKAPDLRGECLVFAAESAALAGDLPAASTVCALNAPGLWADECYFMVADAAKLTGMRAAGWCALAGRYGANCSHHSAVRMFLNTASEGPYTALGQEEALRAHLFALAMFLPDAGVMQHHSLIDTTMGAIVANRWRHQPMHPDLCGKATPNECKRAFELTLSDVGLSRAHCGRSPLRALRGRLDWAPEADQMVLEAARAGCMRVESDLW